MTRKNFHFDFHEDAEPVEELHRLRVAATKHFKTIEAIVEYDRTLPTAKEMIAELQAELAKKKMTAARSRTPKTRKKSSGPRRTTKRLTPA